MVGSSLVLNVWGVGVSVLVVGVCVLLVGSGCVVGDVWLSVVIVWVWCSVIVVFVLVSDVKWCCRLCMLLIVIWLL